MRHVWHSVCALVLLSGVPLICWGDSPHTTTELAGLFAKFSNAWPADSWLPSGSRRPGYMRPDNSPGWRLRYQAFRQSVLAGVKALPLLQQKLAKGTVEERILAAQVIGFLPAQGAIPVLAKSAASDPEPAVRLYAIDSISLLAGEQQADLFQQLVKTERHRDVKRHLDYALERTAPAASAAIAAAMHKWDTKLLDAAQVGKPAPDFELTSVDGRQVRLRDYRNKKSVILVFVYGDT